MGSGGCHGIPQEEDKGGGRDNDGDNTDDMDGTDGTDDAGVGNLPPPGGI